MADREFIVSFPGASVGEANQMAGDLRDELLNADRSIRADRLRNDASTMDFGATLILVLGAPASIAAAKALHDWAVRHNQARLELKTKQGTLIATNLESKDVAAIARALGNH